MEENKEGGKESREALSLKGDSKNIVTVLRRLEALEPNLAVHVC